METTHSSEQPFPHNVDELREKSLSSGQHVKKILVANRGVGVLSKSRVDEISIRVMRSAHELSLKSIAIFSYEDRFAMHRYKADQSFQIGNNKQFTPVGAYLAIDEIVRIAVEHKADLLHPGYGFLAENPELPRKCKENGIIFVGPPAEVIDFCGDKTKTKEIAKKAGVSIVPGSDGPVETFEELRKFVNVIGLPIMIKAAMGGGGRGLRVVRNQSELESSFERAKSEALAAFGNGTVFVERFLDKPRHIEIQILADNHGNIVHLFERDCSVQRRNQKVVEMAPAMNLNKTTREKLYADAIKLAKALNYVNAGTVEFLVDRQDRHYFIEINPRIQVEHTVTEEITGVDIVASQILIAMNSSLESIGITKESLQHRKFAIQCRITTEDPLRNFQPDTGRIQVYRSAGGNGVRLDGGSGYNGAIISPHYDSLLVKVTVTGNTFEIARRKMLRTLIEFRIRGVKTNISFLTTLLMHPTFTAGGQIWTTFIDDTPQLFHGLESKNRAQKLLTYLAYVAVNGPIVQGQLRKPGITTEIPVPSIPNVPKHISNTPNTSSGWGYILQTQGPEGFCKAIRQHSGMLLTDTTWRDAHQSLVATRMRTYDLLKIATTTSHILKNAFSLECWGGATFDVALRFLMEDPWDRLKKLKQQCPNIPFQMLLRGANAVGYTSYPDNLIREFCLKSKEYGIDIFRIFDCLNDVDNMKLAIESVKEAGGIAEVAICYTGDICDPSKTKYTLDYYLQKARELVELGIHILAIKDMAGLLRPNAARLLVSSLRKEFPNLPIHLHTHDTAGTGVASMLAAAEAGADIVDVAVDAFSGLTSQPSMGAIVGALQNTSLDTGISLLELQALNTYWEKVRLLYAGFDAGLKSNDSSIYLTEIPGGQYTNLMFQAQSLGLGEFWTDIKQAYIVANKLCGDIIKVTPSSKVVGDLAQFLVSNRLDEKEFSKRASTLSLPKSVIEFFQGYLGTNPYKGFPEPLRSDIIGKLPRLTERPSKGMAPIDLNKMQKELSKKYGDEHPIRDVDVITCSLYPAVFEEYQTNRENYGDLSLLPTPSFLNGLDVSQEISVEIEQGKTLIIKLLAIGPIDPGAAGRRDVFFEMNGQQRIVVVEDKSLRVENVSRPKADIKDECQVGSPMMGVIIDLRVEKDSTVKIGDPLLIISAMKMETVVNSPIAGKVEQVLVNKNDPVSAGDLLIKFCKT